MVYCVHYYWLQRDPAGVSLWKSKRSLLVLRKAQKDSSTLASVRWKWKITFYEKPLKRDGGGFAAKDIKQSEHVFHVDLNGFQKYTLAELERAVKRNPELDGDHANYVGRGKYVIEDTPASYMNHSCDPNCCFKMKSIAVYDIYALRDIAEGEELTHDYTASAVDQFAGQGFWILECQCGSENCRGKVEGRRGAQKAGPCKGEQE